jgi:hypothetical protein
MKMPWQDKTGLARASAVLATVLLISLGLCGANFAAFTQSGFMSNKPQRYSTLLMYTGFVELFTILGSLVGLTIVGFIYVRRSVRKGKG